GAAQDRGPRRPRHRAGPRHLRGAGDAAVGAEGRARGVRAADGRDRAVPGGHPRAPHAAMPEGGRMSVPRARILIVDDRPENLMAREAILEPLGHELVRADSGEAALRAVLRRDFACILLDVQMPGLNGFETAEMIKRRERSRYTPIIFLTAISKE